MSTLQYLPVFISSGHTNMKGRDRGAASADQKFIEGDLAALYRKDLAARLVAKGLSVTIDVDNSTLAETVAYFKNKTTKNSLVIDLHFNAGPAKATGTETLIPGEPTVKEVEFAYDFSYATHKVLDIPLRGRYKTWNGVKTELESHHGRLGWMRLIGENILHEFCFISNSVDMQRFQDNRDALLDAHAAVIMKHAKVVATVPVPAIAVKQHIVQKGDTLSAIATKYGLTVEHLSRKNGLKSTVIVIGQKLLL